jgi:hypothetical protein
MIPEARFRILCTSLAGVAGFLVVACGTAGDVHLQGTAAKPGVSTNQSHSQGSTQTEPGVSTHQLITYKAYRNSRYGFTIDYPSSWEPGPKPVNNDGMSWFINAKDPLYNNTVSPDHPKDAELTAVGVPNVLMGSGAKQDFNQMLSAVKSQLVPSMKKEPGMVSVHYGASDGWIWITSIQIAGKNTTVYSKQYMNLSTVQTLQFIYPSNQKNVYEPILSHVERSFHPGNGR